MCKNFHFGWIILVMAVKRSTSEPWGELIRYESLPPLHWIPSGGLPQPCPCPQGLPMLPYQSDSLAPPELRALTTYVTVTSIVSQRRLLLPETLRPFQTAKSGTKHVSWWICLAPKKAKFHADIRQQRSLSLWRHRRSQSALQVCQRSWRPDNWQRRDAVWKKWPVADLSSKNLFHHSRDANLRTETWPDSTCRQKWQIAARGDASVKHGPRGHK